MAKWLAVDKSQGSAATFMLTRHWDFIVEAVACFVVLLWAGSLCAYHAQLVWRGVTTNQDIKRTTLPLPSTGVRNIARALFSSPPASIIAHCAARGYVTPANTPP